MATAVSTATGLECATATSTLSKTIKTVDPYGDSELLLEEDSLTGMFYQTDFANTYVRTPVFDATLVGDGANFVASRAWSTPRWNENKPGQIRAADYFTHYPADVPYVAQSSPYPCAENTITITLHSFVPIFAECQSLPAVAQENVIKLSGLDIFQTDHDAAVTGGLTQWDTAAVSFAGAADTDLLEVTQVTETEVLLKVKANQTVLADKAYVLTFRRYNHQKARGTGWGKLSVQTCHFTGPDGFLNGDSKYKPTGDTAPDTAPYSTQCDDAGNAMTSEAYFEQQEIYVQALLWKSGKATHKTRDTRQSFSYPCDQTTITVSLNWTALS